MDVHKNLLSTLWEILDLVFFLRKKSVFYYVGLGGRLPW